MFIPVLSLLLTFVHGLPAQSQAAQGAASSFNVTEYYPAPHHTQKKLQVIADEARFAADKTARLTRMKLQTFREDGQRDLVIEAPDCLYDQTRRVASSPGRLQVQTGDERFSVEGLGFLWRQEESSLVISNEVRSLVQHAAPGTPALDPQPPLEISSRRFEFDVANRRGTYRDQVHGEDPELEFACGVLTVHSSTNSELFDLLLAETNVTILSKTDGRRARADKAVYTRADEIMRLEGNAAWQQGRQEGRADQVVIQRREQSFSGTGNVALKLPRDALGLGGFFLTTTNRPAPPVEEESPLVDVFTDQLHLHTNRTTAQGAVRVLDATNSLTCDRLTIYSEESPSAETRAIAEGHVVVSQTEGKRRLTADRAAYWQSTGLILFVGQPEWQLDESEGRAEQVTVHAPTSEILATGNVAAKVTLGPQSGAFLTFFPDTPRTNQAPQVIEVFAPELRAKRGQVTFLGGAQAHESPLTGSESRLRSEMLEVRFGEDLQAVEGIRAVDNVVYEQGTPGVTNGPAVYRKLIARTITSQSTAATNGLSDLVAEGEVQVEQADYIGRGDRATYTAGTQVLELTGQPTLETPELIITEARTLVWDRAKARLAATPPYKITIRAEALPKEPELSKSRRP
ncbi:MAG: hypothetical protein KIS67_25770 [Verrucomicrobiae bacterium]|nr:hypothetical protein [Verrucomicrobiae bacterium]